MSIPHIAVVLALLVAGCAAPADRGVTDPPRRTLELRHARHFAVRYYDDRTELDVYPHGPDQDPSTFTLAPRDAGGRAGDPGRIPVPVERVVCVSTTHAALFAALDRHEVVVGAAWADNLFDPVFRERVEAGLVRDVSRETDLNMEILLDLEPDAVITYLTRDEEYGDFGKMRELGLPAVANAEFREATPLGQAEWIKFAGVLLGMEERAAAYFDSVEARYGAHRAGLAGVDSPTVFAGLDWKGTWSVPRGGSFAACYVADAGGRYVWSDVPGRGSLPLDFEAVFKRAATADVWLNPGAARSRSAMAAEDDRLRHFDAWRTGRVYNNDARLSPAGGNDYWESGVVRPDLVLRDLIRIFHPPRAGDTSLVYYRRLPR